MPNIFSFLKHQQRGGGQQDGIVDKGALLNKATDPSSASEIQIKMEGENGPHKVILWPLQAFCGICVQGHTHIHTHK